jgi:NADPH:quinone reductase-like Zn-dependent oxidoreductase
MRRRDGEMHAFGDEPTGRLHDCASKASAPLTREWGARGRTTIRDDRHRACLRERGAVPVAYGDGVSERITAAAEGTLVAAFIDLVGGGYVELALALGIARDRIDTIVDFPSIERYGVKGDGGAAAASAATLAELAGAIAAGDLVVPIQRTYRLEDVRAAFTELEAGHIAGKIVLIP